MLFNIVGWFGAITYIIAYLLVSIKVISVNSVKFQGLNLIGAIGVTLAAIYNHDKPSVILNICWGIIAFFSLISEIRKGLILL